MTQPLAILYPLDKSGFILFSAVPEENLTLNSDITELPTEAGANISDHIITRPDSFSLFAVITDGTNRKTAEQQKQLLQRYRANKQILRYIGRNIVTFVAIESASISVNASIANGFYVNLTLKEVRSVALEEEVLPGPDPSVTDAIKIMRIIVGLEPGVPGVDYTVADFIATLRQIVGMQAETRQERDAGFLEPATRRGPDGDQARYIPIKKDSLPYRCRVNVDGYLLNLTFYYDRIGDRFTADISGKTPAGRDMPILNGRRLIYGSRLYEWRIKYPNRMSLTPIDLSDRESQVNFDTLGTSVFLYIQQRSILG